MNIRLHGKGEWVANQLTLKQDYLGAEGAQCNPKKELEENQRWQCEKDSFSVAGFEWKNGATDQGMLADIRSWKRQGNRFLS